MKTGKVFGLVILFTVCFLSFSLLAAASVPIQSSPTIKAPSKLPLELARIPLTYSFSPEGTWYMGQPVTFSWPDGQPECKVLFGMGKDGSFAPMFTIAAATTTPPTWTVPYKKFSPGTYTVRVQSTARAADYLDKTVEVKDSTLSLVAPVSGVTWTVGQTYTISWQYQGIPGPLKLEARKSAKDGGGTVPIADNVSPGSNSAGSLQYTVPSGLGSQPTIYLTSKTYADLHDFRFVNIAPAVMTLVAPVKGGVYGKGSPVTIRWTYVGDSTTLVTLLVNSGSSEALRVENYPIGSNGVGEYTWTPPGVGHYIVTIMTFYKNSSTDFYVK